MKIYQNRSASYSCFFITIGSARSGKNEPSKTKALAVHDAYGDWRVQQMEFYSEDLKDEKRFPVVGGINLRRIIMCEMLHAIGQREETECLENDSSNC